MDISILGAGAWGTALAVNLAGREPARHRVRLWARDAAQAGAMRAARVNQRYLPAITLPASLQVGAGSGLDHAIDGAGLVVLATPMAALRPMLQQLRACTAPVVWLCKGFEPARLADGEARGATIGLMAHEVQAQVAPALRCGVLSGPSFAQEVAQGKPAALVAASADAQLRASLVEVLHGAHLRVYGSDDVVGVEVGGAVKNVLAIACGIVIGRKLGDNARAALITRGLAEMSRLGLALGAKRETLMGLSGLGDLVLTCSGTQSRNLSLGIALGEGQTLQQIMGTRRTVAEGVHTARAIEALAGKHGVDMPICAAVDAVLHKTKGIDDMLAALLARPFKTEA